MGIFEEPLFHLPQNPNLLGVSNLLVSLGHIGRRVVMGHTLNTQTLMETDEQTNSFK